MSNAARTTDPASRRRRIVWLPWALLAIVAGITLVVAAAGSTGPSTNEQRVNAVARTIKCPTCRGESVAESNAELSRTMRVDIAKRVEVGETDEQIRTAYAGIYGEAVLLTPSGSGVAGLVWIIPVVALVLALGALVLVFRRWSETPNASATDDDRAIVEEALSARADRHGEGEGDR